MFGNACLFIVDYITFNVFIFTEKHNIGYENFTRTIVVGLNKYNYVVFYINIYNIDGKRSEGISPEIASLIRNPPQFPADEVEQDEVDDAELAEDEIFVEKKLQRIAKEGICCYQVID